MKFIYQLTAEELKVVLVSNGFKAFRVKQIFEWIYRKNISSWREASNLPKRLICFLESNFLLFSLKPLEVQCGLKKDNYKRLFETDDNCYIEAVNIIAPRRNTICLSTQIGCRYRCKFCASGKKGFLRNLSFSEIIEEFQLMRKSSKIDITNIVFMGMGEPFDNYDNLIKSIKILNEEIGIAHRRITISTAGVIENIENFLKSSLTSVRLAISLHALNSEKRNKIMPINKKYKVEKLIDVLKSEKQNLKDRLTLEYILIAGFNDSLDDATRLIDIAKKTGGKVNLIEYNYIEGLDFHTPMQQNSNNFLLKLRNAKVQATLRYSAGADISAACGQLALNTNRGN